MEEAEKERVKAKEAEYDKMKLAVELHKTVAELKTKEAELKKTKSEKFKMELKLERTNRAVENDA